eukprot:gnl/TRDRNA2_/TRDRNA2_175304_c1_seq5.p1 gnl/TRDRNA2_/TRDRNA2_175304_c1~~gnl/TRDRNA2_/TRDRNA2_175304_c1_seq5.p1  ORF type:complete len:302 (-),score=29.46 gnl/TRDRNA2_/TRDRNA2_175304_c1_seq5:6-911(-)
MQTAHLMCRMANHVFFCANLESEFLLHKMFAGAIIGIMLFFVTFGYIPFIAWLMASGSFCYLSWVWLCTQKECVKAGVVLAQAFICAMSGWSCEQQNKALWRAVHAIQELKDVHSSIDEQLRAAVHSVLSSTFDASCICDANGCIAQYSKQMEQMLSKVCSPLELLGKRMSSLAVNANEEQRIRTAILQARECNAVTIQTCLVCSSPQHQSDRSACNHIQVMEVKLTCVRCPALQEQLSLETKHSMSGGLFIGILELGSKFLSDPTSDSLTPMPSTDSLPPMPPVSEFLGRLLAIDFDAFH